MFMFSMATACECRIHDVYQQINKITLEIADNVQYSEKELLVSKSWRKAVEGWLRSNVHITINRNGKELPIFRQSES